MGNTQRELRSVLAGAVLLVVAHAGRADIIANLVAQVSEAEIQAHIAALEGPRASVASQAAAAAYVTGHFESLGYSVIHDIVGSSENVIATLPGQMTPELVFIIGAHFDTVSGSPGADDNASGVAGVLEIARVLAGTPVASSIELIAFGLEELGLMGSTQYAQAATAAGADIIGMLSLEMIAYTCATSGCQFPFIDLPPCLAVSTPGVDVGTFIAAVTNGASAGLRNVFVGAANTYVPGLHHEWAQVAGDGSCFPDTRRSDHAPFWDQGYPALMLTDTANFRNPNYHQPTDTLATLDLGFARLVTQAALAAAMMAVGPESATPTQTPQDSATPTSSATRPEASPLTPTLMDTATPTPTTIICTGDCSGDGEVTINELITGVNIALGNSEVFSCPEFDANDDGEVAINELITAVNSALNGCVEPTQIDQAEQKWQEWGISSYRIEVLVVRSVFHAQYHQITVRNNEITDESASCVPMPADLGTCEIEAFNAQDYTVPGLFAQARAQVEPTQHPWLQITYDPIYGFPRNISFDIPDALDEEWGWFVTDFEVVE